MRKLLLLPLLCVCVIAVAQYPYEDTSLTPAERATDIVSRMTLEEKISLMSDGSRAVERLGIKSYN